MRHLGLIIGLEENRAIVLTAESKVLGIKKSENMFLGQKVLFSYSDILNIKRRRINNFVPAMAGIAALLMLVFGCLKFFYSNETIVFIDVDINPSIEFAVDSESIVKYIHPINEDADVLIRNITLKNIPFTEALKKYMDKAMEKGYLNANNENSNYMLVSATLNAKSREFKKNRINTEKILESELESLKYKLHEVYGRKYNFQIVKVPEIYKEKSVENNISMGKYLIYEKLKEKRSNITIDEIKSGNLYSILKSNGLYPLDVKNIKTLTETTPVKVKETITPNYTIVSTATVSASTSNTPQPKFSPEFTKKVQVTPGTYRTPEVYTTATATSKPTQIIIQSDPVKEVDTAQYNFENGFQDFKTTNAVEFYNNSDNAYAGSKSLKIRMKPGFDEYIDTSKVDPGIKQGTTIIFHVWVPDTSEITAVEPFYQNSSWEWTGNWTLYSSLTPNKWNTIKLKVKDNEVLPVKRIGVKIAAMNKRFDGTIYIDSILWD